MRLIYSLMLAVSLGATIYFIDTPKELIFSVLFSNLLALMGIGLYKICDKSGLWETTEEEM